MVGSAPVGAYIEEFATGSFPAESAVVSDITQLLYHDKISLTSELVRDSPRVLQKLLKYFSGTIISTFLVPAFSGVLPVNLFLNLVDSESVTGSLGSPLKYCHKLLDVLE